MTPDVPCAIMSMILVTGLTYQSGSNINVLHSVHRTPNVQLHLAAEPPWQSVLGRCNHEDTTDLKDVPLGSADVDTVHCFPADFL